MAARLRSKGRLVNSESGEREKGLSLYILIDHDNYLALYLKGFPPRIVGVITLFMLLKRHSSCWTNNGCGEGKSLRRPAGRPLKFTSLSVEL